MCTCTPQTHIVEYKGGGAPVAQDVTSHRTLKIQQKQHIWVLIGLL